MEWAKLIEARHTTFAWDDRVPDKELILEVLEEVYQHIPSKNLQFPYQVRLLRNDDPVVRKEIMTICQRNGHETIENDRGNPQVLAPWLLGFNSRWVSDLERRYEKESSRGKLDGYGAGAERTNDPHGDQVRTENLEIGIFSAYIMLALASRGIQSGMCQNICNNFQRAKEIFKLEDDARAMDFRFIMGIGYGKSPDKYADYYDPRIEGWRKIPFVPNNVEKVYPRPILSDVVKIIE